MNICRKTLMFAIVTVGMLALCHNASSHTKDDGWRRTSGGWERLLVNKSPVTVSDEPRVRKIHPLLLACWQAAAGIGGLMMGEGAMRRRRSFDVAV